MNITLELDKQELVKQIKADSDLQEWRKFWKKMLTITGKDMDEWCKSEGERNEEKTKN